MDFTQAINIYRIPIAQLPTPIEEIDYPWSGHKLYIKRDDLTGSVLSGNKIRKLEYLLADAKSKGCDTVITCGGVQSNHAGLRPLPPGRSVLILYWFSLASVPICSTATFYWAAWLAPKFG